MQTTFSQQQLDTLPVREADRILRSCVHCGFCNATCPTFLETGNELDGPRGRIYLIKEVLETGQASSITQTHLDRCLTCQACESTCPSNVRYHHLLNIGRDQVERKVGRSPATAIRRWLIRKFLNNVLLFSSALSLGRMCRKILPAGLQKMIPVKEKTGIRIHSGGQRKMLLLNGCVQNALAPNTNAAAARVLARLGITAVTLEKEGCCGAINYHLNAQQEGLEQARQNIDLLCEQLDQGVEAIISSASGCGNFIKDYAYLLAEDTAYAEKAARIVDRIRDLSEVLMAENLECLKSASSLKLAFHCPCSLQHGQQLEGSVDAILARLGFTLTPVADSHLCCGSAGTYSLLQPKLARRLRSRKLNALEAENPDAIATANIGCQYYLGSASRKPVRHWIEYVDEAIGMEQGGAQ